MSENLTLTVGSQVSEIPTYNHFPSLSRLLSTLSTSSEDDTATMTSTQASSTDLSESISWANLPVVVQFEQHPSCIALIDLPQVQLPDTEPCDDHEALENDDDLLDLAPEQQQQQQLSRMLTQQQPIHEMPAKFGWGDFPLISSTSFDYPWKYCKAQDEDGIIVPIAEVAAHAVHKKICTKDVNTCFKQGSDTKEEQGQTPHRSNHHRTTVSFSVVQIREYSQCFGDHPWCPFYPVSLDWTYNAHTPAMTIRVDDYEASRDTYTCCWSFQPRRLDVLERRARLAQALRVSVAEIDILERYRQTTEQVQWEQMHRVPTMIVLTEGRGTDATSTTTITNSATSDESKLS